MPTAETVPDPDNSFCCVCRGTHFTRLHDMQPRRFFYERFSFQKAIVGRRILCARVEWSQRDTNRTRNHAFERISPMCPRIDAGNH
jgi:hypothetical protein